MNPKTFFWMTSVARSSTIITQGLRALFALCILVLASGCSQPPAAHHLSGSTMGTVWSVTLANLPAGVSPVAVQADIEALLELINRQMSTYQSDSDISRFNRSQPGDALDLAPDFRRVLASALHWAEESGGAYDPTVGPLVNLWGFGPETRQDEPPPEAAIAAAMAQVGWQKLRFDETASVIHQAGDTLLDLSSLAKGFAVDRIAEHLEFLGVESYMVDIGGDLRVGAQKPSGEDWRIAIERPVSGSREINSIVAVQRMAVATSGDYRNFFRDKGRDYSHIIDPRSGHPVTHGLASVTVLHESCMEADALATLLTVLGAEEGLAFAEARGLAVLLIERRAQGFVEYKTPAFTAYLHEEVL